MSVDEAVTEQLPIRGTTPAVPGVVRISDAVVARLAARAAMEIPDVGGVASRGFSRMGGGHRELPRTSAHVESQRAYVDMAISVRWPAPVAEVTHQLRAHVSHRLNELAEVVVADLRITVTDLITQSEAGPRVR